MAGRTAHMSRSKFVFQGDRVSTEHRIRLRAWFRRHYTYEDYKGVMFDCLVRGDSLSKVDVLARTGLDNWRSLAILSGNVWKALNK